MHPFLHIAASNEARTTAGNRSFDRRSGAGGFIAALRRTATGARIAGVACIVALASALVAPTLAAAEVRGADVVAGKTMEERGIAAADMPDISAASAVVIEPDGTVLFERNATDHVRIASITKVMTAIVALEHADLDNMVTVDEAAATVGEATSGLRQGDTLTLEDALRGLLVPSGNDAAMAIASSVGALIDANDPYQAFIDAMNAKATELGMNDTLFTNPHGLDFDEWSQGQHSCARDVGAMCAYAMQNETLRSIVGTGDVTITVTGADGAARDVALTDVNQLVGTDGNIGIKTGTTDDAGMCFAGAWLRDGVEIYTVVLGCPTTEQRFGDSTTLANWYYAHRATVPTVTTSRTNLMEAPVVATATDAAWTDKTVDVTIPGDQRELTVFDLAGDLAVSLDVATFDGAVNADDDAGTLTVLQDGEAIAEIDLIAAENVPAPSPFEWVMVQLDRLVRWVSGQPTEAAGEVLVESPAVV